MSSKKKFRTKAISTLLSTAMTVTALSGALAPAVMATTSSVNMGAVSNVTLAAGDTLNIYDNGGPNGVYSDNCNDTLTINAPAGYGINLSGSYHTEATYDKITINGFNSNLVSHTFLSNASGSNSVNIVSYGNTMTIKFTSDRNNSMDEGATGYAFTATLFEMHSHSFTYSVDGDTVSATCTDGCTSGWDSSPVTLTIVPPTRTVFNDNGSAAATLTGLDAFNSATGLTLSEDSIKYVGRDETTYTESATAPVNAGKYTAKLTYGDYTISTDYEIAKAEPVIEIKTKTLFYKEDVPQKLLQSETITPGEGVGGVLRYSINDMKNLLKPNEDPMAEKIGDYTVYYRAENDDSSNYVNQEFSEDRKVSVSIIAVPVVSMEDYTYGTTLPEPAIDKLATDATFYYNTTNSNEGGTEWTAMTSKSLNVGTYYMYAEIAETDDHVATTTEPVEFKVLVAEATPYVVTATPDTMTWTGTALEPEINVKDPQGNVVPNTEYTVSFENNTEPGTASITITDKEDGNYTVSGSAEFTIIKDSFTPVVTMNGYVWGSEPSTPTVVENTSGGEITYYYNTTNSNEGGTEWKDIEAETLKAGTYYMYAVVGATDHYFEAKSAPVEFEISKKAIEPTLTIADWEFDSEASEPVVTGNLGNATPEFTYYLNEECTEKTTAADGAATDGGVPTYAGNYYLQAVIPATTNYQGKTIKTNFTITKKVPVMGEGKDFDVKPLVLPYNGESQILVELYTKDGSGLKINLSHDKHGVNVLQVMPNKKDIAEYPIYYMVEGNRNYESIEWRNDNFVTAKITKAPITISGITADDKTYDGTTDATLNFDNVKFTGLVEGEDLKVTATGKFESKVAGEGKTVNISGLTLSGADLDHYELATEGQQETTKATISPKEITVSGIAVKSKLYDGTTTATLIFNNAVCDGTVEGDNLAVTAKGTYDNANAGSDKVVTISGLELTGDDKDNYVLATDGQQIEAQGAITLRAITITAKDQTIELDTDIENSVDQITCDNLVETEKITAVTLSSKGNTSVTSTGTINASAVTIMNGEIDVTANYNITYNAGLMTVIKYVTRIDETPTAADITYGQSLADSKLTGGAVTCANGAITIEGTFTCTDSSIKPSVSDSDTTTYEVTFTPSDAATYDEATCEITVTVAKANPEYTVPTGLTATYGQTLADVDLPDGWTFADTTTSVGNAGTNTFKATFTPADTANYNTISDVEVKVTVAKADPEYTVPTGLTATYGQTLADVKLPEGWAFADATASVGNAGTNTFKATFTPKDATNYNTISNVEVKVTVAKADATVKTAPTAIALTENGSAQALVNAGAANNGTMQYAIGTDAKTAPTSVYSTTIPTGTAVGTYYVWYKVVGAANYNDSKASCVTVTIAAKPVETGVAGFVERLYTVALGRESDPDGKKYWIDQVRTNGKTGADIAKGFLYSEEFLNSKASNEDFVETLYKTFFDRASEPEGKAFWVGKLADGSMSKMDVINGFINSTEWANLCLEYGIPSGGTGKANKSVEPNDDVIAFATRLYTTCLGRDPEAEGLKYWSTELANMRISGTDAAYGFFFSDEFVNKNLSNEDYVKSLYRTFMGREYDTEGFNYWVGRLNNGASRQEVFFGFAQSQEFGEICSSYGIIR